MPGRLIYVDDTSPLISYDGPWAVGDTYSVNTVWGGPFNNTLHALSGSGSFTFSFTGPSVSVIGTFQSSTLPSWTCYIDGHALISNNIFLNLNNVEICSLNGIQPKATPSNLTVVASGDHTSPFLLDRVQYEPDASVILDNATVVVDAFDDQIGYLGWSMLGIGMETSVQGSFLIFDFVGIQITWITAVQHNSNIFVNALAQYSIDNGTFFPFRVTAKNSTVQQYTLVSFQTPVLSPGSHRLFVEYRADNPNGAAPLVLNYFVIRNQTTPPFTLNPPNLNPPNTTPQIVYRAGLSKGAIAGVVIGSLVGLALIIFSLIWAMRFINRKKTAASLGRRESVSSAIYGDGLEVS